MDTKTVRRLLAIVILTAGICLAAGTQIDLSNQVRGVLGITHGGTGTASTLTGLVRGNSSAMTAAEISGDCTTSGSNAITCTKSGGTTLATVATTGSASDLGSGTLADARLASDAKVRPCEIIIGDPGSASAALANDNDTPDVCVNKTGSTLTITGVNCYSDAGSPTVTPIISGGSSTSILSGALTCSQTQGGASGTLNGTPTETSGQSIDANITTAGGTAKYVVIIINRTL